MTTKPANDCNCCSRRFEMLETRLREAVARFGADLIEDGATESEFKQMTAQASTEIERFILQQREGS